MGGYHAPRQRHKSDDRKPNDAEDMARLPNRICASCEKRRLAAYFVEKLGCDGRGFGLISGVNAVQLGGFRLDAGVYGVFVVLDRWFSLK